MTCLVAPLLLIFVLAGCDNAATTVIDGNTVELRVHAYRYDRQHLETRAGQLTFRLTNEGPEPTNFRIRKAGTEKDVLSILTMEPGESDEATESFKPGEYEIYSSVGRHETLGETGTLTLTPR